MERCEWNPIANAPADVVDGCENVAVLSVGAGENNLHLCQRCADLPRFARLRRRVPLRARDASQPTGQGDGQ